MPAVEQLMGLGGFDLEFGDDTPTAFLDNIDIRTRLWATYHHTADHWNLGDLSEADLMLQTRYAGRVLGMGPRRHGLSGEGILGWLGRDGEGGNLFSGVDTTTAGLDFEGHLDASVFASSNGLTKGSVNANAVTFSHKREGGDTRFEMLFTLCKIAPGGPYYFRVNNNDYTIDADTLATLWPTNGTPTVLLINGGTTDTGDITGIHAIFDLEGLDGSEVRTGARVDYADGASNGSNDASLPATYDNLVDGDPVDLVYIDWRPKRPRPPTERPRKVAAWGIAAQARADILAADEVNERTVVRPTLKVDLPDLRDPWQHDITPGNAAYCEDIDLGLHDTANQIPAQGETAFPTKERVEEMTTPFYDGGGHYIRCWDGVSDFEWIDLTDHVVPEDGPVELLLNHRTRFPVDASRRRMTPRDRRLWKRRARHDAEQAQLEDFYAGLR